VDVTGPVALPGGDEFTEVRLWNFTTGVANLKPQHKDGLFFRVIPAIQGRRDFFFVHLIGMASRAGGDEANLRLSRQRVANVRDYLIAKMRDLRIPLAEERLRSFEGVGEEQSFGSRNDPFDRAVRIQITRSPEPVISIPRLPRGGETVQPPSRLQLLVASVLRDPVARRINFTSLRLAGAGIEVSGTLLGELAMNYLRGHIDVQVNPAKVTPGATAAYNSGTDILFLRHEDWSVSGRGLIVHESVHALNDKRSLQVRKDDDEAAAYVAQVLYLRLSGFDVSRGVQQAAAVSGDGAILLKALRIADKIIASSAPGGAGSAPSGQDWLDLAQTIGNDPLYADGHALLRPYFGLRRAGN
jgi:hypothetical protein